MTSPLVLRGFEGPGGWSTGLRMAGFTCVDLDTEVDAAATAAGHRPFTRRRGSGPEPRRRRISARER